MTDIPQMESNWDKKEEEDNAVVHWKKRLTFQHTSSSAITLHLYLFLWMIIFHPVPALSQLAYLRFLLSLAMAENNEGHLMIWLIAILALVAIFVLFYVLDKWAEFLAARRSSSTRKKPRPRFGIKSSKKQKMATILEQHVSTSNVSWLILTFRSGATFT